MHVCSATGVRGALFGVLMAASLVASAAGPKTGGTARTPVAVQSPGAPEPPTRLIVRYKTGVNMAGQGGVTLATERHEAALRVARTAHLSGVAQLQYLKSVSPTLHVVLLPDALTAEEARAAMQRLREDDGVAEVAVDHRVKPHLAPNDPRFTDEAQWHLQNSSSVPGGLNAPLGWDFSIGAGVVVAVLDGGYRPHADLVDNILLGYDFVSAEPQNATTTLAGFPFWTANDGNARDPDARDPGDWVTQADVAAGFCDTAESSTWHGTHVAGLVAAVGNNARDGLGVAYGAKVLPVRVLGRCGGYVSDILAGARWAAGLSVAGVPANPSPARILNLSLGLEGAPCDSITQSTIDELRSSNVTIVASSGNEGGTQISMPANCSGVIAVTAHTREGDNADYANVGAGVSISAPGGGANTVFDTPAGGLRGISSTGNSGTTVPGFDRFAPLVGTSMAAPQVSGVLALLAAQRPDLRMVDLERILLDAVRPFPAGSYCATNPDDLPAGFCGQGMLDAGLATAAAVAYVAPPPVATQSDGGGGGCTVAPDGQADAGLPLLALVAGLGLLWRRRAQRGAQAAV